MKIKQLFIAICFFAVASLSAQQDTGKVLFAAENGIELSDVRELYYLPFQFSFYWNENTDKGPDVGSIYFDDLEQIKTFSKNIDMMLTTDTKEFKQESPAIWFTNMEDNTLEVFCYGHSIRFSKGLASQIKSVINLIK